ncbi:MAG: metallophosphoesterase family protein [Ectothiorhodospiraceae bacterium]|nr:metallophosphoesterase family protein [Chromatiales bacterium]MCP5154401.1 metallophosphoesterase family protein [Ectothiorhodospiraceae bacterium]
MRHPNFDDVADALIARVPSTHLRLRLGIELDHRADVFFGPRAWFFHLENWYSMHGLIRTALRACGLHQRGRRNVAAIEVRHHDLPIHGLPAPLQGLRVLHLSDLHLDLREDLPAVLMERIYALDYDVAVLTGDFRAATSGPWEPAVDALRRLRSQLGESVFAVLGNHDSIHMVPAIEACGIRVLLNEWVPLERDGEVLYLAGVDDPHYFRADNLERAADGIPAGSASLLLAHSPEIYRRASHAGFGAMLCGHTHGGQICLPGGFPVLTDTYRCPRRYCRGAWEYRGMHGYTSVGSGASVVDVRLNCPPEVTLHRLIAG